MNDLSPVSPRRAAEKARQAAAAIARAADVATDELAYLRAGLAAREAEVERMQEVCDDRQLVIDELTEHSTTYRRAAEDRAGLLATLDVDLKRLRKELERAVNERRDALAAAEEATQTLDDERQQARLVAQERDADLRAAHRDADALRARTSGLEKALAAREEFVGQLQAACDERLMVIERLGDDLRAAQRDAAEMQARSAGLENALALREKLVAQLQAACDERLLVIERLSEETNALRVVAEERAALIDANELHYRQRYEELAAQRMEFEAQRAEQPRVQVDDVDWRSLAEERERALIEVSAEAERRSVLLAEVTSALEGRTREIEALRKRLARTS